MTSTRPAAYHRRASVPVYGYLLAMRCQHCQYILWGLSEPRCPECGTGFDLRDFAFEPASVAFACPHCGHLHAGQGKHHQPGSEDQVVCRKCEKPMDVASMSVVPLREDANAIPSCLTPWERYWMSRIGWWKQWRAKGFVRAWLRRVIGLELDRALLATCWRSMLTPTEQALSIGRYSRAGRGNIFALLTSLTASILHVLMMAAFLAIVALPLALAGHWHAGLKEWMLLMAMVGLEATLLINGWFAVTLISELATHLGVLVTGPHRGDLRRTALAVAYGQGPAIVAAIPLFGLPVAYFWCKVSTIIQLSVVQGISIRRAAFACLWLPIAIMMLSSLTLLIIVANSISF